MNNKLKSILFIYIGTVFYAIASYFHLSFSDWNLSKAFMVAIPLVCIEYFFSLQGNKYLNEEKVNPISIVLITMCFYFINTWILNLFIIKNKTNIGKELLSLILILGAFMLSGAI